MDKIAYIFIGIGIFSFFLTTLFFYFFKEELKKKVLGEPKKETFTLNDLPQNLEKRKEAIGKTLLDIKSDTSKIINSLEETKELIKENTEKIISEIKSISTKQTVNVLSEATEYSKIQKEDGLNVDATEKCSIEVPEENSSDNQETTVFNSTEYMQFYVDNLLPIFGQIEEEDKVNFEVLLEIMKLIDEKGDCPSVVSDVEGNNFRSEKIAGKTSFDILKQVSLRKHTLNVAEEALKIVKEKYNQITPAVIKELIIAFAHDLGKLPDFRPKDYSMTAHPVVSAKKLEEYLSKATFSDKTKQMLIEAVEDHHKQPRNDYGKLLKQADQKAREREKREILGDEAEVSNVITITEKDDYLIPEKEVIKYLLEYVVNYVNKTEFFKPKQKSTYFAYYIGDKVYVEPDIFYYALRENSSFQLPEIFYSDNPEDIKRAKILIANTFRKLGYLDKRIGEGFHSAKFAFYGDNNELKKTFRGMSISVEAFNEINFSRNSFPRLNSKDAIKYVKLADSQKGV